MLCESCSHKSFCKHYDYITNTHCLKLELKSCDNHSFKEQKATSDVLDNTNNQVALSNSKKYPDLKEIIENQLSPVVSEVVPLEVKTDTCQRCKQEFKITELEECSECHRFVCSNCRVTTLDSNTNAPVSICERCWSGEPDPDVNQNTKVTIRYGQEENTSWDLDAFIIKDTKEDEKMEDKDNESTREQMDDSRPNKKSKRK